MRQTWVVPGSHRIPAADGPSSWRENAVGETAILLYPPLPLAGVLVGMERERQQNGSRADGILLHRPLPVAGVSTEIKKGMSLKLQSRRRL